MNTKVEAKYKIGDTVSLKSGGVGMTVQKVYPSTQFSINYETSYDLIFFVPGPNESWSPLQKVELISESALKPLATSRDYRALDLERALALSLDPVGIDAAIEAATESNRAGQEPQEQILSAVRAYLYVMEGKL